jgi:hypothetical protein
LSTQNKEEKNEEERDIKTKKDGKKRFCEMFNLVSPSWSERVP